MLKHPFLRDVNVSIMLQVIWLCGKAKRGSIKNFSKGIAVINPPEFICLESQIN